MGEPFQIPPNWQERVREYVRSRTGGQRDWLSAEEFEHDALLRFADGSVALFHFALVMEDPVGDEVAVFTEHCGYHVFPASVVHVTILPDGQSP